MPSIAASKAQDILALSLFLEKNEISMSSKNITSEWQTVASKLFSAKAFIRALAVTIFHLTLF